MPQDATACVARATPWLQDGSNRIRMVIGVAGLQNSVRSSLAGRTFRRFLRFGVLRGVRSIAIDPEDFRRDLANKHGFWVPGFAREKEAPTEGMGAPGRAPIQAAAGVGPSAGAGARAR